MAAIQTIIETIERLSDNSPAVVVGVSGFAGSGKSTLARNLNASIDRSARIRGDDFLDPVRSHQRSADWSGMDRLRLRREVLDPFRERRPGHFHRFDWRIRQLGPAEPIPNADVLIVDAVGLFHPDLDGVFDLTIWVDLDLAIAIERGKARDRELGRDHEQLWDDVWAPNELDFMARYAPRAIADVLFDPASSWCRPPVLRGATTAGPAAG